MNIRSFEERDYEIVSQWWRLAGTYCPELQVLLNTKTFIASNEQDRPMVCVTLHLGDSPWFAVIEDLIADPHHLEQDLRRNAILQLWEFLQNLLRALKYKRAFCFTQHDALVERYLSAYGWSPSATGVTSLMKNF